MAGHITAEEFDELLKTKALEEIVSDYIFAGIPFAYREFPRDFELLKEYLAKEIGIRPEDITVVGSGKTGFSIHPEKFPRPFHKRSDIDIVVVNETVFDDLWFAILEWYYPIKDNLSRPNQEWVAAIRKEVYRGYLQMETLDYQGLNYPGVLNRVRDIKTAWFVGLKGVTKRMEFGEHNHEGRLYRTWGHAEKYHVAGLRVLRKRLITE